MTERPIKKVLIANRGEIAVRIARGLRVLGIESVVVFHRIEADGLAVRTADHVVELTGDTPVSAYLDATQIVRLAVEQGADAIHPGYGFLAENADFAEAVAAAGLIFIGPGPDVIRLMGDKVASRNFVRERGFPVAPSVTEDDAGAAFLEQAGKMAFPLLVKASAGGGGKGMHIVRDATELEERIATAKSEAARYFADDRVYCERYVERPRHIEVQILADRSGNCVHLWERECSIQRRFQKIIEESPSPGLSPALRSSICEAAVGIARAAGYLNAGTVEFILAPDGEFYFLEMNTRLQVEHPVTELVTGIDLVAEQIAIANGDDLTIRQEDVQQLGHAIECRLYAEDADDGFVPATGQVLAFEAPEGPGVRFDGGIVAGQEVTAAFDPMLAKLIVHGASREQAIQRMRVALAQTVLLGVTTNIAFLDRVLAHPACAAGEIDTDALDRWSADLVASEPDPAELAVVLAAACLNHRRFRDRTRPLPQPYAGIGAWRN